MVGSSCSSYCCVINHPKHRDIKQKLCITVLFHGSGVVWAQMGSSSATHVSYALAIRWWSGLETPQRFSHMLSVDWISAGIVSQNSHMWLLHVACASSQHGGWLPRASISRANDLVLEFTQ